MSLRRGLARAPRLLLPPLAVAAALLALLVPSGALAERSEFVLAALVLFTALGIPPSELATLRARKGPPALGSGAPPGERLGAFYGAMVDLLEQHGHLALAGETSERPYRTRRLPRLGAPCFRPPRGGRHRRPSCAHGRAPGAAGA